MWTSPIFLIAGGLLLSGGTFFVIGLVLHTMKRRFQELEYYMRVLVKQTKE